jgi:DNA-directed RNA polymerase subunit alpha
LNEENIEIQEESGESTEVVSVKDPQENIQEDLAVELLKKNPTTVEDVDGIRRAAFSSPTAWEKLDHYVCDLLKEDDPDFTTKEAIGLAVLGRYDRAESKLEAIQELPVAACLLARIYKETGRESQAVELLMKTHKRVPEVGAYHIFLIEALEAANDWDGFLRELERLEAAAPDEAWTSYFKGLIAERDGEYEEAKQRYLATLEKDPKHGSALFRMAYRMDLEGEDDQAIDYYRRCVESGVSNVAALVNLGLLYDDQERYEDASDCFGLVEMIYPQNERAKSYLRDSEASKIMYYDEEKEKKEDKQAQILRIPVTDFELSVRSRNCLSKMNIRTLGDLIKKTEAELLAFKNFGETSLQEIKGILASKGLRLGMMTPDNEEIPTFLEPQTVQTEQDSFLNKPLDELDLSVRSRNCLNLLQIKTLGQLAETSEQQLLSCKNFGQTSLNEIRKKLSDYGLSLKV